MLRKIFASAAVAASALVMVPGTANAEFFLVSRPARAAATVEYQLTPEEHKNACGSFQGSIIFSDGSSLDCITGVATMPVAR